MQFQPLDDYSCPDEAARLNQKQQSLLCGRKRQHTLHKTIKTELSLPTKFMVFLADGEHPCIFFHL